MMRTDSTDISLCWSTVTGYALSGITAVVSDETRIFLTGKRCNGSRTEAAIIEVGCDGRVQNVSALADAEENRHVCVFPNVVSHPDAGQCLFYSFGSSDNERPRPGCARLVSIETGETVWETPTVSHHAGNGSCIVTDVNGDGEAEIVWWDSRHVFCNTLRDGSLLWPYGESVQICHGRPTLADINGDGLPEIVLGTEYAEPDGTSAVIALSGNGTPVWRSAGHSDDLGSTPVIRADIDGDGRDEFLIVGLDLVHHRGELWSSLWCFDRDGALLYQSPCGCGSLAIGPREDGTLNGVGVTNTRDGGNHGVAAIRCFDLSSGSVTWETPIARVYLDSQNPVMADLCGEGRYETVVATGNPSGYGMTAKFPPFADVYVVDADGRIRWSETLPDYVHQPFVGDIDADGRNELLLPCADGTLYCYRTHGRGVRPWPVTGGGERRWYFAG